MNSSQIKSFLTAAECLNFTQAADKLYISQPVLSRNIAALENELDVLLFTRTNNAVQLTPAGEIIYRWLRESQVLQNDVLLQARQANALPRGELRIGFVLTEVPTQRESSALVEFQKRHPETQLTIFRCSALEIIRQLTDHSIDIGIMLDSPLNRDLRLEIEEIAEVEQCLLVSKAHPLAEYDPISLRAFANDVFISVKTEYSPVITSRIHELCGAVGFIPRIREADSTIEQLAQVEAQQGVTPVPSTHISQSHPLVRQLRLKEGFTMHLVCCWDRLNTNPSIEQFLTVLRETK